MFRFARWLDRHRAFFRLWDRDFGRIVSDRTMPYRGAMEHGMALFNKIFTTRILVKIIFVLTAVIVMKAISLHYDFSWMTALAGD